MRLFLFFAWLLIFTPVSLSAAEFVKEPLFKIETGFHTAGISRIAVDPNEKFVVSVSPDKSIRISSLPDLKPVRTIYPPSGPENEGAIYAAAISKDGRFIAVGGETGFTWDGSYSVYIFEAATGAMVRKISNFPKFITYLQYSPDGNFLAVGLAQKGIRLLSTADWRPTFKDMDFNDRINCISFSAADKMAGISKDGVLKLYSISDNPAKATLLHKRETAAEGIPDTAAFSPDGKMLAIGYDTLNRVEILSVKDLQTISTPYLADSSKNLAELSAVAWSKNGRSLYAGGRRGAKGNKIIVRWLIDDERLPVTTELKGVKNSGKRHHSDNSDYHIIQTPFANQISDIIPLSGGRILFASFTPGIAMADEENRVVNKIETQHADFKGMKGAFLVSNNGNTIQYTFEKLGNAITIFSFDKRGFLPLEHEDVPAMTPPSTSGGLNITDWYDRQEPKLNGVPLDIAGKYSRSLAVSSDSSFFLLGVDSRLHKFDSTGKLLWRKNLSRTILGLNISGNGKFAIAALGDGTIRWLDPANGKELLAFFPHPDRTGWIAWTPEGYFDASQGAEDIIGYILNRAPDRGADFITMKNMYDVFYRPDIIQARLAGEDISSLASIRAEEALKNPPPTVSFTKKDLKEGGVSAQVCYQIRDTGGGIGEIRLFHNGKLVKSDGFYRELKKTESQGDLKITKLDSRAIHSIERGLSAHEKLMSPSVVIKPKGSLVDDCLEIETVSGENEISLTAFNSSNSVQSIMTGTSFISERKQVPPHLYILAVGVDRYRDSDINLKYAAKDAHDFISKLSEKVGSIYKKENIHLTELTDSAASKASIMKKIGELAGTVKHGDGFIFFNASHGVLIQNQYFIVTSDFNGSIAKNDGLISSNEIVEMSKQIKSLSQLFIFDTCHAGGVDNIVSGLYDARMSVLAKKMGLHIYAASGSMQSALDGYDGNGLYTHTLLEGISKPVEVDTEKQGLVTVKSLGRFSREKTTAISKKIGHPQTPLIISFGRDNPLFKSR